MTRMEILNIVAVAFVVYAAQADCTPVSRSAATTAASVSVVLDGVTYVNKVNSFFMNESEID